MKFTAKIIADYLKGEVVGNEQEVVTGVSKIEEGRQGTLSFLANPKYEKYIYSTDSSIVLVNKDFEPSEKVKTTLIKVEDAYKGFAGLLDLYVQSKPQKKGIHKKAVIERSSKTGKNNYIGAFAYIGENVRIGNNVKIYPHAYIGDNVTLGDNTIIYAGVKIYEACVIGADCVLHAGVVIGADGFGFAPQDGQEYKKIPQLGNVILEDFVEIGANSTIDRATMGSTIVKRGVKLDNLVHLGHNVVIESNTVMAAQGGVAGSTKIGKNCMFGGQVGIAPHVNIADGVKVGAKAGIAGSIKEENSEILGAPAFSAKEFMKSFIVFKKLPEIYKRIGNIERNIKKQE